MTKLFEHSMKFGAELYAYIRASEACVHVCHVRVPSVRACPGLHACRVCRACRACRACVIMYVRACLRRYERVCVQGYQRAVPHSAVRCLCLSLRLSLSLCLCLCLRLSLCLCYSAHCCVCVLPRVRVDVRARRRCVLLRACACDRTSSSDNAVTWSVSGTGDHLPSAASSRAWIGPLI